MTVTTAVGLEELQKEARRPSSCGIARFKSRLIRLFQAQKPIKAVVHRQSIAGDRHDPIRSFGGSAFVSS
jgi:hypothetical protein